MERVFDVICIIVQLDEEPTVDILVFLVQLIIVVLASKNVYPKCIAAIYDYKCAAIDTNSLEITDLVLSIIDKVI